MKPYDIDRVIALIKSEMKPSMGCTEPVAVGLAVSNTCTHLENPPTKLELRLSSNIFKNAYCVKIPNTTKAGIPLAATLGYLLAKPGQTMEIFAGVTDELVDKAEALLCKSFVKMEVVPDSRFYIEITASNEAESVQTITMHSHDNLVKVTKNGEIILDKMQLDRPEQVEIFDITRCTIQELVQICQDVALDKILFLREAVKMNLAVSQEGLSNDYGLGVGKNIQQLLDQGIVQQDLLYTVKMVVSAASDCRMGGGALSAMTVLGSGNQGFEAILPVAAAAQYLGKDEESTLRAVMMSILITIHIKYHVGRLSPICGATLSGSAASGAIAWLLGGTQEQIEGAIQNMLGNLSGMICDGAKDGCALKLSNCSGEAVMSARLSLNNNIIQKTDGIVSERVEDTIRNVARLSTEGMSSVDMNIIDIMMSKESVCEAR